VIPAAAIGRSHETTTLSTGGRQPGRRRRLARAGRRRPGAQAGARHRRHPGGRLGRQVATGLFVEHYQKNHFNQGQPIEEASAITAPGAPSSTSFVTSN
jgi:hypothetical protein